jgi:Polyketide cyclase / dehydrase and lipid transport
MPTITIGIMRPIRITTSVPYTPERVYDFLEVMANHALFTDHMLTDWEYSGPDRGVGAKARVKATAGGRSEPLEIEIITGERPRMIVEQNVGAGGRRVATATYTLEHLPTGETQIAFEYAWKQAPLAERVAAPLVRAIVTSTNKRALSRLAEQLPTTLGPTT